MPPLLKHGLSALALLRVFVNALPSIPAHRRLRLFATLLSTLESEDALGVFLTLLLAKAEGPAGAAGASASAGSVAATDSGGGGGGVHEGEASAVSLAVAVSGQFVLEKQLSSMNLVLESIARMPASAKALKAAKGGILEEAYAAAAGSVEQLQRLQQRLVQVVNGTLGGRSFAALLQALPAQEEAGAQRLLLALFERVLELQQRISQEVEEEAEELDLAGMSAKSLAAAAPVVQLARRLDEAQQLVGRHLSVSGFVATIQTLLRYSCCLRYWHKVHMLTHLSRRSAAARTRTCTSARYIASSTSSSCSTRGALSLLALLVQKYTY